MNRDLASGAFLIFSVFAGIFIAVGLTDGWVSAIASFTLAFVIAAVVALGTWLLARGLD